MQPDQDLRMPDLRLPIGGGSSVPGARFGVARLYWDAGAMAVSSVASAVLGAVFWALAAKLFPPANLGVMTAVMSAITAAGVVVASGVGDAYTALLPAVGGARERLYRLGQRLFWRIAAASALAAAIGTVVLIDDVRGSIGVAVLVMFGVLAWSAVNVQSSAVAALGRARWLPAANIATGTLKIALLPVLAAAWHWHAIELAFVIATSALALALHPAIVRAIKTDGDLPPATLAEPAAMGMFNGFLAQSVTSSGLNFGVVMLSPFMVTAFSGPVQGAVFALALSVVQVLDLITVSMSIALVVHASGEPEGGWVMARAVLIRSTIITGLGALVLVGLTPVVLRWLDPRYGALGSTGVVATLCAVCVVRTVYTVWSGLQRARRTITMPLAFNAVFAAALPMLMWVLCRSAGALGGSLALLLGQTVLSIAAGFHLMTHQHQEVMPHAVAPAR